jgi:hypothetical protein
LASGTGTSPTSLAWAPGIRVTPDGRKAFFVRYGSRPQELAFRRSDAGGVRTAKLYSLIASAKRHALAALLIGG